MLKKFFISLLILSALTSETTTVAAYLAAAGLYASGGNELYSQDETPGEPAGNLRGGTGPQYSLSNRDAMIVPMEEILRVRASYGKPLQNHGLQPLMSAGDALCRTEFSAAVCRLSDLACTRTLILVSSDSSPPVL